MNFRARIFLALGLSAFAATVAPHAVAQPQVNVFEPLTFEQAKARSIRDHRVLVVFLRGHAQDAEVKNGLGQMSRSGDAFAEMDERTWQNPTLGAWLKWHAVVVQVSEAEEPARFAELAYHFRKAGNTKADPAIYPHIGLYKGGSLVSVIPHSGYEEDNGWTLHNGQGMSHIEAWRMFPKPVGVLAELDHALQIFSTNDPVWGLDHERLNPPPEPPAWKMFHDSGDPNAPRVADPPVGSDLLDRLDEARAAVRSGDLHAATGLYTWAWERLDALDPIYRPSRAAAIGPELAALAEKRPPAQARLLDMRSTIEDRYLWWDGQTWLEYLLINECLRDAAAPTATVSRIVGNVDEDALATPQEHAILDMLFFRPTWTGLDNPSEKEMQWLNNQPSVFKTRVTDDNRDEFSLRSRLFFDESCRVYAALLKAGREPEAATIASSLITNAARLTQRDETEEKLYTNAGARRALVATALIAGQTRAEHASWLKLAAAEGQSDPHLLSRVNNAAIANSRTAAPKN